MASRKRFKKVKRNWALAHSLSCVFLRHLSEAEAYETLKASLPFKEHIIAVGLDSSEVGNPPSKFQNVFEAARKEGYKVVAHAGEEGDSTYIWEALTLLHVNRIDHGIRCEEDAKLVEYLKNIQMPLTVCPLSNVKLRAIKEMRSHNILTLLREGLLVTVNSDDPAYFGGYLNENYEAIVENLDMSEVELKALVANSFKASFLSEEKKREYLELFS